MGTLLVVVVEILLHLHVSDLRVSIRWGEKRGVGVGQGWGVRGWGSVVGSNVYPLGFRPISNHSNPDDRVRTLNPTSRPNLADDVRIFQKTSRTNAQTNTRDTRAQQNFKRQNTITPPPPIRRAVTPVRRPQPYEPVRPRKGGQTFSREVKTFPEVGTFFSRWALFSRG